MSDYRTFKELFRDIYYRTITINETDSKQDEFNTVLHLLKKYSPKHDKYVTLKNNIVDNVSKFYEGREKIIQGFKNEVFPFCYDREDEEQMGLEKKEEEEEETITDANKCNEWVIKQETSTNKEFIIIIIIIVIVMIIVMIMIIITIDIIKMETIFMNTENSKTNESHRFKLDLADKLNLENPKKNIALAYLSIYYTWKNIKSEYNNNKFKLSAPNWNETFDLPDGFYSIDDIQDYFEFIIKNHETLTENPSIQIYPNKIKNRITFKIKNGYKLELLTAETMKFLGSTKKVVDKNKNGENVPKLESVEVILVHCNLVKTDYQHASKVLFTFVPNKKFGQLLNISPHVFTMMNTINTEFSSVEV